MKNPNNRVIVQFPNNQRRVRHCQSSVYPTQADMRPVRNINDWFEYCRFLTDAFYGADAALDATIAGDTIIQTANQLLTKANLK